jgi:hypothetical protein
MKEKKVTALDLKSTKSGKYLVARAKGMTKKDAAIVAGYGASTPTHNVDKIERSQIYQALEKKFFKDALTAKITLEEIGDELIKNIKQDANLGAKNQAIQIALDKLEPEDNPTDIDERVFVVIK